MKKLNVYIASGWFTEKQTSTYEKIVHVLCKNKYMHLFLPKEASKHLQNNLHNSTVRTRIFLANILGILTSDIVICSTEDKDLGSIFEAGYAFATGKPIIYVNFNLQNNSFNLMLSESSIAVAKSAKELVLIINIFITDGQKSKKLLKYKQKDKIE